MRRLFWAGLILALDCLAVPTWADELQFRPAGQAAPVVAPDQDPAVVPTAYNEGSTSPLFRGKTDDMKLTSLPDGPPLPPDAVPSVPIGDAPKVDAPKAGQKPEEMPVPKPLPNAGTGTPGPTVITPGAPPGVYYGGTVIPEAVGPGGEPGYCGEPGPHWCEGIHKQMGGWNSCCSSCDDPCAMPLFYARGEFLLWSISRAQTPPLVTSTALTPAQIAVLNPPGAAPTVTLGGLGELGTTNVFGGNVDTPSLYGGRFTIGVGDLFSRNLGFETTFFILGQRTEHTFLAASPGMPLFAPFLAPDGTPLSITLASAQVDYTARMWGIEANLRTPLLCDCVQRLDLIGGFRFIELKEDLVITRDCGAAGCPLILSDAFGTRNRFFGGQLGLDYEYRTGRWILGANGKVALGVTNEIIQLGGSGAADGLGLLVRGTNAGRHSTSRFAVVPEVGVKLGYQITDNLSVYVGYSALYMSNVARPGDQIDLVIDPTGTLRRPAVPFRQSNFWAQGFNTGLEWKF